MAPRPRPGNALVTGVLLALVAGCAGLTPPSPPDAIPTYETIDGQAVGQVSDCVDLGLTPARCDRALAWARSALDRDHPDHAPIAREALRGDVRAVFIDGQWHLTARSGEFVAMVEFDLADRTRLVETVACGVWQPGDRICDPAVP